MFEGIIALLRSFREEESDIEMPESLSKLGCSRMELAFAVVLVDVAMVDNNFDDEERHWVFSWLKRHFYLSRAQTIEILKSAQEIVSENEHLERYAKYLREHLNYLEREEVVRLVDRLVAIDGHYGPFEKRLREVYEEMLGVHLRDLNK